MAFAKIYSAQSFLLKTHLVSVEIDLSRGLHAFSIVGLPDKGIEESKDRVSSAIKNSGFKSPKQINKKVVVSLAPADMKKEGPLFDLPIALAYLLAEGHVVFNPTDKLFAGELALDGSIRPIRGALSYARLAKEKNIKEIYVPIDNAEEAALIEGVLVFGLSNLREVIEHLLGHEPINPTHHSRKLLSRQSDEHYPRLENIAGLNGAKRAITIAVSGGHNIALFGPPGTGKTMLAKSIPSIIPELSFDESLEVTEIYSVSGHIRNNPLKPPFRSPHHTSSYSSIIGGGSNLKPGEVTLAHNGVLFMDEFPEFDSRVIEALRQPLEERVVSLSRSRGSAEFPANFMLIIAFNPCPCGNKDIQGKSCTCTPRDIEKYRRKLSGPIIDRIDMWIEVSKVEYDKLIQNKDHSEETTQARNTISSARNIQKERFISFSEKISLNSQVNTNLMKKTILLEKQSEDLIKDAAISYELSGRGTHRIIKLARTIADIEQSAYIKPAHILEALQYRQRNIK